MLVFEHNKPTTVKLAHAKGRKENHGDVKVLALDLSITFTTNNRFLDTFAPGWREAMFSAVPLGQTEANNDQEEMDLRVSDLPFLRMAHAVYPLKFDKEYTGHTLRLDYGRGGDSDKVVQLCKLKSFQFTPIEGGSVEIHYSLASAADITGDLVGAFSELIQQDIVITLLAPAAVEGGLIDASAGSGAPGTGPAAEPEKAAKPKSKAVQNATDAFVDMHAPGAAAH